MVTITTIVIIVMRPILIANRQCFFPPKKRSKIDLEKFEIVPNHSLVLIIFVA